MAPSAANFSACATAVAILDDVPPWIRDDPDFRAIVYCFGMEGERKRLTIEEVRRQFFPQYADVLLKVWEAQLGMTVEPAGYTVEERRTFVFDALLRIATSGTGLEWEEALLRLAGEGVVYQEFDPTVPSNTVAAHTIRITLPFPPSSDRYARIEKALRARTPANTDIVLTSGEGFILDVSQLDQEPFGGF